MDADCTRHGVPYSGWLKEINFDINDIKTFFCARIPLIRSLIPMLFARSIYSACIQSGGGM